jgi:hypothetical protein
MIRSKIRVAIALMSVVALSATVASAAVQSFITNATIVSLRVDPANGQAVLTLDQSDANRPACSTFNNGRSFQIPLNTDAGREATRVAMAAFLAGKKIDVTGSSSCPAPQSNKELLAIIEVHN